MIISIQHKGLKLLFEKNDASKIQPQHLDKIRNILTRLEFAETIDDLAYAGSGLHQLSGNLKDFWAVKVDKNYRIIFRFEGNRAYDLDYLDYH